MIITRGVTGYPEKELDKLHDLLIAGRAREAIVQALVKYQEQHQPALPTLFATLSTLETGTLTDLKFNALHSISEKFLESDKFKEDREDVCHFVFQKHEKMKANYDRFPTTQCRMAYVINRVKGPEYAQILPYIKEGVCELSGYNMILDELNDAVGDPNLVNNA